MIFGKLHDEIFRPLSGANRHIVEKVLKRLWKLYGDEENPESDALPRRVVLEEIHQVLIIEGDLAVPSDEEQNVVYRTPATAAEYIYRRLLECGWLEIEEDGYNSNVILKPESGMLLESLLNIEAQEKKSYGQTVLAIYNHLETVVNKPEERGSLFFEAIAKTREFTSHLRNITYSLKEIQERLAAIKDPRAVLANFFEEFVEAILIADYKTLNSADNPFRFRGQILEKLRYIEYLDSVSVPLNAMYQDHYGVSEEEAQMRFLRDVRYIRKIFESVDQRLSRIDSYRFRLESRVGETVKMMGRTMPGMANRLLDVMQHLATTIPDESEGLLIPSPPRIPMTKGLSPFSLRAPRGRKEQPAPQILKIRAVDPFSQERNRLIREFMKKRAFEPMRVMRYIDAQMQGKTVMTASEFRIDSVDDLLSFLLIGQLSRMRGIGQLRAKKYIVRKKQTTIKTEWVACRDFTVERPIDAVRS